MVIPLVVDRLSSQLNLINLRTNAFICAKNSLRYLHGFEAIFFVRVFLL